jgi:hypothetical protein
MRIREAVAFRIPTFAGYDRRFGAPPGAAGNVDSPASSSVNDMGRIRPKDRRMN